MSHLKKLLPALLAVSLLAGCANNNETPSVSSELPATGDTVISVPSDPTESESANPENLVPEAAQVVNIEDFTTDMGNGLREIKITSEPQYYTSRFKDGLILSTVYGDTSISFVLTDLTTGQTHSASVPIKTDSMEQYYAMLVNGYPVIVEATERTMTVYDKTMTPLRSETLDFNVYSCESAGDKIAFVNNSEGNQIILGTVSDDGSVSFEQKSVILPEEGFISIVNGCVREDEYLISCFDNNTFEISYAVFNAVTDEVIHLDIDDYHTACVSDGRLVISESGSNEIVLFEPESPDTKQIIISPDGTYTLPLQDNSDNIYLYSSSSQENGTSHLTLYRYDLDSCSLSVAFEADIACEYLYLVNAYEYDGYILLDMGFESGNNLVFCQPQEQPKRSGYDAISGADFTSLNYELAQSIKDKYSIEVYYGSEGVRHFEDYAMVAEIDEKLINSAMKTLDSFFAKFPEGFFKELISKSYTYNQMNIYLTGKIIPNLNESQSISDAAAFVTTENEKQLMVLDITQSYALEKTVAHEFMHIIENAMFDMCYDENGEWLNKENFQRWDMLNPAGFEYYYSYTDEYGTTLGYDATDYNGSCYYEGSGIDINSIYFVDGYAMTYPKEDRARLFEYIATCTADKLPEYFNGTPMKLKAAYLCACIRDSFDCITEDTAFFPENVINREFDLDYFRENYDIKAYWEATAAG